MAPTPSSFKEITLGFYDFMSYIVFLSFFFMCIGKPNKYRILHRLLQHVTHAHTLLDMTVTTAEK